MSVERPIQVLLVGVTEMILQAQQREAGSEHVRLVRWGPPIGVAALYLQPHQGETFGELWGPEPAREPSLRSATRTVTLIQAGQPPTPG